MVHEDPHESSENPTAPGIGRPGGGSSAGGPAFPEKFSLTVGGELAYTLIEAARALNITPQHYTRMMITDGLKGAGLLPKWWKRGSSNV